MSKPECIAIFNAMIRGTPVDTKQLFNLISEYLTENNIKNSDKIMNLVVSKPQLIEATIPTIVDYYCRKYSIFILTLTNKTILYYE